MIGILLFLSGLTAGGVVAWLLTSAGARARVAQQTADLQGRASAAESLRDELREQIKQKDAEIFDVRSALNSEGLSAEALRSDNQSFLELAKQTLEVIANQGKGDIEKRQAAIDALVKPLQESLKRYEEQITQMEQGRKEEYGGLKEQLRALSVTQQQLQRETGNLVTALRTPQVRGQWGEVTLHRVVELAGMSQYCDYVEQVSADSETGRLRPDMIIHLPSDREIVVDAKASLDAYLDAVAASGEVERNAAMARHARQIRTHMNQLAAKSYWEQFPRAPEFVVMFIPGESFFASAVDCDRSLIEDGMGKQVALATPTTLIALLRAVAFGWRQEQITENAKAISDLGKQLSDRLGTLADHLSEVGKSLGKATLSYNKAVGSMELCVFPAARRFKELGAAGGDDIPILEPVDQTPRQLDSPNPDGAEPAPGE